MAPYRLRVLASVAEEQPMLEGLRPDIADHGVLRARRLRRDIRKRQKHDTRRLHGCMVRSGAAAVTALAGSASLSADAAVGNYSRFRSNRLQLSSRAFYGGAVGFPNLSGRKSKSSKSSSSLASTMSANDLDVEVAKHNTTRTAAALRLGAAVSRGSASASSISVAATYEAGFAARAIEGATNSSSSAIHACTSTSATVQGTGVTPEQVAADGRETSKDGSPQKRRAVAGPSLLDRRGLHGVRPLAVLIPKRVCEKGDVGTTEGKLEDGFSIVQQLGLGSTSTVQRAVRKSDGMTVALKVMRSRDDEMVRATQREFETMRCLEHPNIVRALDLFIFSGQAVLVLDYLHGLTLAEMVRRREAYDHRSIGMPSERVGRRLGTQLLEAVGYMHCQDILHRDIKPENIIVSEGLDTLKLVDFNTSTSTSDSLTPAGTMLYMAPEVIFGQSSTQASDVWGAFLCIFLMLSGRLPQKRDQVEVSKAALEAVANREVCTIGHCWAQVSEPCKQLIKRGLAVESVDRPTANEALVDPWIAAEGC